MAPRSGHKFFTVEVDDEGNPHLVAFDADAGDLARIDQERAAADDKLSELVTYAVVAAILSNRYPEQVDAFNANAAHLSTIMARLPQGLALGVITLCLEKFATDFIAQIGGVDVAAERYKIADLIEAFHDNGEPTE